MNDDGPRFKIGTVEFRDKYLRDQVGKANFKNITNAAASIAKDAKSSLIRSPEASQPGTPPHTRRGLLARAIRFDVAQDKKSAVIGPRESIVGTSGEAMEFGGDYKGENFPPRPFMAPALEHAIPRLAGEWAGSIGE